MRKMTHINSFCCATRIFSFINESVVVGVCWYVRAQIYSMCSRLTGSDDGPEPAAFVQEDEAVQQDGHVTISWDFLGHPSVCVEARTGNKLTVEWMGGQVNRSMNHDNKVMSQCHACRGICDYQGSFFFFFSQAFLNVPICQQTTDQDIDSVKVSEENVHLFVCTKCM